MRWIFFSLLVVNTLLFAWGTVMVEAPAPVDQRVRPFPYSAVASLSLLREVAGEAAPERAEAPESVDSHELAPEVQITPQKPLCELVGAFEDRNKAGEFVERLSAISVRSSVRELELPAGERYQVFLPPQSSRKEALRTLTELQAKKIDSYVIPKGPLENGISLGLFSQKPLAYEHLAKMEAQGLDADISVIERTYWEIWVMLDEGEGKKMSSIAWARALEGLNDIERRQNFCLDVAS